MQTASFSSWRELLADPGENGHIVQLYQDDEFYGEAITHFAAEGLTRGESIILVATAPHWQNISGRLRSRGFDLDRLFRDGQLTLLDADETLPKFMADNLPDGSIFKPLAKRTIAQARAGGKFPRVRWWGEMVNCLYVAGNGQGSHRLEQFFDEVAHEENIAIFCSFLMDKFDPKIYAHAFGNVCSTHSHVIPASDYALHRMIINRALAEVVGDVRGPILQSLVSWKPDVCAMPSSHAVLLWVREHLPQHFEGVLARARELEKQTRAA
ncbi:MAG: MEDS domain-containing protein [Betaproteobacteria bacterium]|nr:MEDS domain-containing protein [Betaproteobacteria bacterium]